MQSVLSGFVRIKILLQVQKLCGIYKKTGLMHSRPGCIYPAPGGKDNRIGIVIPIWMITYAGSWHAENGLPAASIKQHPFLPSLSLDLIINHYLGANSC